MANSRITLWKAPELKKEKRMLVDDIDTYYLKNSLTHVTADSAVYVRHDQYKELKVTMAEAKQIDMTYNYCTIDNYTVENNVRTYESRVYYWIDNVEVLNINTIRLQLTLDYINTLGQGASAVGNPQNFTAKSQIYREHQDRFLKPYNYDIEANNEFLRNIDLFDEGINPVLYKQANSTIDTNDPIKNWYVLYKTSNALSTTDISNPIDVFIYPEEAIKAAVATEGDVVVIEPGDLVASKYYYFTNTGNSDGTVKIGNYSTYVMNETYTEWIQADLRFRTLPLKYIIWWKDGANIKYQLALYDADYATYKYTEARTTFQVMIVTGNIYYTLATKELGTEAHIIASAESSSAITPVATIVDINSYESIDRTDSQNMKLILLPYCPINYTYDSTNKWYVFGEEVVVSGGVIALQDYTKPFTTEDDVKLQKSLYDQLVFDLQAQPDMFESASMDTESKLYSSQFMLLKLLYDSFSAELKLERLHFDSNLVVDTSLVNLVIKYKASNTMSGNFGFQWEIEDSKHVKYNDSDDYPQLLLVNRNNELSLYNNDYVNYIRAGYNYDKKAQALGAVSGVLSTVMQGASAIASNNPMGLISAIGTGINTAVGIAQSENNMQARLAQLSAQATRVNGSNDVDMMQWYCDNKLKLVRYEPDSRIKVDIWKKLMYNGYVHRVEEKPDVTSRIWYNYLECTPAYTSEGLKIARRDWLEQLTSLYEQGVTVYHWQNEDPETVVYDFDRQYENWESWIFEE